MHFTQNEQNLAESSKFDIFDMLSFIQITVSTVSAFCDDYSNYKLIFHKFWSCSFDTS